MPRFYFIRYLNGQSLPGREGRDFENAAKARVFEFHRAPALLRKVVRSTIKNTFLATEISDGKRTLFVVRLKLTSEKR